MLNKEHVLAALESADNEKNLQEKIINSVNDSNYNIAELLVKAYDQVCEETDKLTIEVIKDTKDDVDDLNEKIEDIATEKYGPNTCLGVSLSFIVSNLILDALSEGEVVDSDTFVEEQCFFIHTIALDKYFHAKDPLYKDEMLDLINNNISRSISLRKLFRGDREGFEKYNPDLYFDALEQNVCGTAHMNIHLITSCCVIEELIYEGEELFRQHGFSKEATKAVIEAQRDMEEIKLAACYIQAQKRGLDLDIDYSNFSEKTIECIRRGFTIGEEYKDQFIEKGNVKRKTNI